jgi:hypothetical protein
MTEKIYFYFLLLGKEGFRPHMGNTNKLGKKGKDCQDNIVLGLHLEDQVPSQQIFNSTNSIRLCVKLEARKLKNTMDHFMDL